MTTTRQMSDAHEDFLVEVFGGRKTKGSGNQWRDPADGKNNRRTTRYAFGWDGKSTLGQSLSISRGTWTKLVEQTSGEMPMLPLRFYANGRLEVDLDLAVVTVMDLSEVLEAARDGVPSEDLMKVLNALYVADDISEKAYKALVALVMPE